MDTTSHLGMDFVRALLDSPTFLPGLLPGLGISVALIALAVVLGRSFLRRMVRRRPADLHRDEAGAAVALDFALTLPVFVVLVLLVGQYALLVQGQLIVHYSAYVAARTARAHLFEAGHQAGLLNVLSTDVSPNSWWIEQQEIDRIERLADRAARFALIAAASPADPGRLGLDSAALSDAETRSGVRQWLPRLTGASTSGEISKRHDSLFRKTAYAFYPDHAEVEITVEDLDTKFALFGGHSMYVIRADVTFQQVITMSGGAVLGPIWGDKEVNGTWYHTSKGDDAGAVMRRALHAARREDGSIVLISMVGLITLALMIILVLNTGFQLTRRIQVQNAADAHAMTQASWTARSLNVMAMNQVGITQAMAVSTTSKALSTIALASWTAAGQTAANVASASATYGPPCAVPKDPISFLATFVQCSRVLMHITYTGGSAGVGIDDSFDVLNKLDASITDPTSEVGNDFEDIALAFSKMNEHLVETFPEFAAEIASELALENDVEEPLFHPRELTAQQRASTRLPVEESSLVAGLDSAMLCRRGSWGSGEAGIATPGGVFENFETHGYPSGRGPYVIARDYISRHITREVEATFSGGVPRWDGGFLTGVAQAGRPLIPLPPITFTTLQHHTQKPFLYPQDPVSERTRNASREIDWYTHGADLYDLFPFKDFIDGLPWPVDELFAGVVKAATYLPPTPKSPVTPYVVGTFETTEKDNVFRPSTTGKLDLSFTAPSPYPSADHWWMGLCATQKPGVTSTETLKLYHLPAGDVFVSNEDRHAQLSLVAFTKRDGGAGIFENSFPSAFDETYAYAQARVYNVSYRLNRYGNYVNPMSEINARSDLWTQGWRARLTPATLVADEKAAVASAVADYAPLEQMLSALTEADLRLINVR